VTEKGVTRKLTFRTKRELEDAYLDVKQRERLRKLGIRGHQGPITYRDLRARFKPLYNPGTSRSERTLEERLTYSKPLDDLYVRDLTPETIQTWLLGLRRTTGKRKGEPLHPTTVSHALNALRLVLDFGMEQEYLEKNPARSRVVRPPRAPKRKITPFESWKEVLAVAKAAGGRDDALIRFACGTGMREQEWQALDWSDVEIKERRVHVRQTVSDGEIVPTAKTDGSLRTITLNKIALDALRDLEPHRFQAGLVFRAPKGGMVDATNWRNRVFYPALDTAGLARRWPKEMRHTFATLSIAARPDLLAWVSRQMGHTTIDTTVRYYKAWLPSEDATNVAAMDAAIDVALRDRPKIDPRAGATDA
jgi:integrase